MRFGPVPLAEAEGAILAHSVVADGTRLRKGRRLGEADLAALAAAGIAEVTVARLEPGDLGEDAAAAAIAAALAPDPGALGLTVSAPFTGRVNLFAAEAGLLRVAPAAVAALNAVDPAITLATLADHSRVQPRQMVATVKIIPYGVPSAAVEAAVAAVGRTPLRLHPFRGLTAALILTRTPGMKESLIAKGAEAVATRLAALGLAATEPVTVAHDTAAVAAAIAGAEADLVLLLTASATSDAADTGPAGLVAAGGGSSGSGCRSIRATCSLSASRRAAGGRPAGLRALAGAQRGGLGARPPRRRPRGHRRDIAGMGVGGLLKEIPTRPQPRAGTPAAPARPRVEAILLAAGAGRRMGGRDKLLEPVGGRPMLARAAEAATASQADRTVVVLPPGADARRAALAGLPVAVAEAPDWAEGMAASLRAGLAAVSPGADAVVVLLADMPEVTAGHVDRLIAAFDPGEAREICRAVTEAGSPGHPVLFGRRFFESLRGLEGDRGARDLLREAADFVTDVPTPGRGATVDLDTPEAWAAWRAAASA
jgi:molybdenum cofactor cytidylyltransferase